MTASDGRDGQTDGHARKGSMTRKNKSKKGGRRGDMNKEIGEIGSRGTPDQTDICFVKL